MPPPIPITQEFPVTQKEFNTWSHPFQGANTPWRQGNRLQVGNFFAGLQGNTHVIMPTPTLPPGAVIQSAELELVTAVTGNGAALGVTINSTQRGTNIVNEPMVNMFGFEGWRAGRWSAFEGDLRNSSFELLTDTPVPVQIPNAAWAMRWQDSVTLEPFADKAMRKLMGDRVVGYPLPPGGDVLTQGFIRLSKQGNPATTGIFVDIYSSTPALDVNAIPDTLLASSDEIPIALIGPNNLYALTFTGVNQIRIIDSVQYFMVIRPSQPYVPDALNYVSEHHHNAFGGQNRLRGFGVGMGVDWQNFPGTVDCNALLSYPLGVAVPWNPPLFPVVGQLLQTPDITALVQAQLDLPEYDALGDDHRSMYFSLAGGGGAANRIFASFLHATLDPPLLRVTWIIPVPGDKLADPASRLGRHRIIEPWDDRYYRFKYGKDKPEPVELVEERVGTWTGESEADIERPSVMSEMLDQDRLDAYDARNAQNERDIAELEAYILAGTQALAQDVGMAEAEIEDQEAFIAQLETNIVMARDALIAALDSRRKHQNLLAAIEAVIRNYY